MVAEAGIEPAPLAYETNEPPLLYSANDPRFRIELNYLDYKTSASPIMLAGNMLT